MHFVTVSAAAFGRLSDASLSFTEGLNIFYGPNESGKSSWHAAIYAGLCGLRKGHPLKWGRLFKRRHRPWDGDQWAVAITLLLKDGRKVAIERDLDNKTTTVVDAELGRNLEGEIIFDGAPDGSVWLGLNRTVFPSIAFVRQAQLSAVADAPDSLQEFLQRAAAASGKQGTAVEAIETIKEYSQLNVGLDRANSTKPLRRAIGAVGRQQSRLNAALEALAQHENLLAEVTVAQLEADSAVRDCRRLEAVLAQTQAEQAKRDLERARELSERYPQGPPEQLAGLADQMKKVGVALSVWRARPDPDDPPSQSAQQLESRLAELGDLPAGDLTIADSVREAERELRFARRNLQEHEGATPASGAAPDTGGATEEQLKTWAAVMEQARPKIDSGLSQRQGELRSFIASAQTSRHRNRTMALGGIGAVAGGLILLALGYPQFGLPLALLGIVTSGWVFLRRGQESVLSALEELREVEDRLGASRFRLDQWSRQREEASEAIRRAGLPADADQLRALAADLAESQRNLARQEEWRQKSARLTATCGQKEDELKSALQAVGVVSDEGEDDLALIFLRYQKECQERAAARELRSQLKRARNWQTAREQLANTVRQCRLESSDESLFESGLEDWLARARVQLDEHDRALRGWEQLQHLLGGGSLPDLQGRAESLAKRAQALADVFGGDLPAAEGKEIEAMESELEVLEAQAQSRQDLLIRKSTQLEALEKSMAPVSDCEEALEHAQEELERVRRLDSVLKRTTEFLTEAQDRVHRNIAPVLVRSMKQWLGAVTQGRYDDLRIDPEDLKISLHEASSQWREASLLSHGTAEQVYLLLRVALATYLTDKDEVCPLILDDVTVQADAVRTRAILEVLREISQQRQVILFSQEEEVLAWAEANLAGGRDQLVALPEMGE